jgi:hypothetical protein
MKRIPALLLLAAAALPGCYFVRHAVPLDARGMEYPLQHAAGEVKDQAQRTGATISGLPASFAGHCRACWRNLTTDPADY